MLRQVVQATIRPSVRPASMTRAAAEVGTFQLAMGPAARAPAYAGVGLDVATGEQLLVGIASHSEDRGYEHRIAAAITGRRLLFGGYSTAKGFLNDIRGCVWHDEIVGIEAKKASLLVGATLVLHTARGPIDIAKLIDPCPEIEAFYRALLQIPAGQRGEPGHAPLTAGEHDPVGAHAARSGLWYADERTLALMASLEQGAASGQLDPATATDLIARVLLAHRSGVCTPAGYGESHVSPLAAIDFGAVLTSLFGAPLGYQSPQPGTHWLDVRVDPSSPQTSAALKALGIASLFAFGIGLSPGRMIAAEMMAKPKLAAIRFVYADVAGGCAYEMYAHGRRLEHGEGELAHAIHLALREAAWPVLARRAVVGWHGAAA